MAIDLNDNPFDTKDGIHSAAIGGIYTGVLLGFAGISAGRDALLIRPRLPKHWHKMEFSLFYRGWKLRIRITKQVIYIDAVDRSNNGAPVFVEHEGVNYGIQNSLQIFYA